MWIELPGPWIFVVNCLGIPFVHLLISWWTAGLPARRFCPSGFWFRSRGWERTGKTYQRLFLTRRWKSILPDGATWFKGFAKGRLDSMDLPYLERFVVETCRGEFAHWLQLIAIFGFIAWTPWPFSWVIIVYSMLSNFPCIINLRHTRGRLQNVIEKATVKSRGACGNGGIDRAMRAKSEKSGASVQP